VVQEIHHDGPIARFGADGDRDRHLVNAAEGVALGAVPVVEIGILILVTCGAIEIDIPALEPGQVVGDVQVEVDGLRRRGHINGVGGKAEPDQRRGRGVGQSSGTAACAQRWQDAQGTRPGP
jgi:hypothetical protein